MKVLKYNVKEEDVRNIEGDKQTLKKLIDGINPKEHIFELDFGNVANPMVTMSTGIMFQEIANIGFPKIVIKNHKFKDQLKENAAVNHLIGKNIIEIL